MQGSDTMRRLPSALERERGIGGDAGSERASEASERGRGRKGLRLTALGIDGGGEDDVEQHEGARELEHGDLQAMRKEKGRGREGGRGGRSKGIGTH